MKTLEYSDYVAELGAEYPDLAEAFGRSDSIENVLNWMAENRLPPGSVKLIGQDEFSYDFLIRRDNDWLVFGVN